MTEAIYPGYEVSSEGAVRHWLVPYARMTDVTPTPTQPARMTALTAGTMVCGTVLALVASESMAVVDFTCGAIYLHSIRNVLTYNGGVEATWGAINIGDRIYYDGSATMPAGTKLSTSPLDNAAAANDLFGTVAYSGRITFPLGGVTAATVVAPVMQRGAGA